jgi:BirA family transcriptional regulator, biotin operon repressor / biotin---[acetyl-CoA-carboxylase] ligase
MSGAGAIWDVRRFDELDSTNRHLLDLARAGAEERVVVVADHQTAGRGRLGRTWEAPPGAALLLSVLLRPSLAPERLHLSTVAVALAAADATEQVAGFRPALKWPNDLVVDDRGPASESERGRSRAEGETSRKLGGILAEVPEPGSVVVGLGLNVTWIDPPPGLEETAVALNQVVGHLVDRDELLAGILANLERRYDQLRTDPDALVADYRAACSTIGRRVRVELGSGTFFGTATEVTAEGHLVVDDAGVVRVVSAGDVVHLRSAETK